MEAYINWIIVKELPSLSSLLKKSVKMVFFKRLSTIVLIGGLLAFMLIAVQSCKTGEGCAATEKYKVQAVKDFSKAKKGKSKLFKNNK